MGNRAALLRGLIQMMSPNTAFYIQMSDQLGTLETGKFCSRAIRSKAIGTSSRPKVAIEGGVVVVDKR
jgi:hypothetical protein